MKIIILGAGRIGSSLAIGLAQENNEITLVDLEEQNLRHVGSRVDLRTLCGNGAHPNILQQAGAEDADMLVALTKSDEVNMIACQVAYSPVQHAPADRPGAGRGIPDAGQPVHDGSPADRRPDQPGANCRT